MASNSAEMLDWAKEKLAHLFRKENALHSIAFSHGSLVCVKWLTERGYCDWKNHVYRYNLQYHNCTPQLLDYIVEKSGHVPVPADLQESDLSLEMVRHTHEKYHLRLDAVMMQRALERSNFEVAQYLHLNSRDCKLPIEISRQAAATCQIEFFHWCQANGFPLREEHLDDTLIHAIIANGTNETKTMKMLQCLYSLYPKVFFHHLPSALDYLYESDTLYCSANLLRWFVSIGLEIPASCLTKLLFWSSHRTLAAVKYLVEELKLPLPREDDLMLAHSENTCRADAMFLDVKMYLKNQWRKQKDSV